MDADFLIVGGGMAGASAGFFLSEHGRVILLERESQPGYHSTGRSAALYSQAYGNPAIRPLTVASRPFFDAPPAGFSDHPLLTPRGAMFIGREDQAERVRRDLDQARVLVPTMREISPAEARAIVPILRPDRVAAASLEPDAMDMDVHAIHQGFLRGLRTRGGRIVNDAELTGAVCSGGGWAVETSAGRFSAPVLINAAGAWADAVAQLAGVGALGLVPKRRTGFIFAPPPGVDASSWPMVCDIDEEFYFKPEAGKLLGSPADETPVEPGDVQPEELDVAIAADRIQTACDIEIRRIERSWAGLRSFFSDRRPTVGFDPRAAGFFWLAGQGGYGIQTAPGMGRLAAALATGGDVPSDIADLGFTASLVSPERFEKTV